MKKENISVCIYTPFYLPVIGGTEYSTHYLSQELRKHCDINIYTFNWIDISDSEHRYGLDLSSSLPQTDNIDGIPITRYPIHNFPIVKNFSWELIQDIKQSNYDIVHFQGLHRLFSRYLIQKNIKNKITILTTHALQEAINIIKHSKSRYIIKKFFVNSLKNFDHIIALSNTDIHSLKNLGINENKITRIPNGINVEKFSHRRKFVNQNDKFKILCVARFDENKKYENLIYVINKLRHVNKNLEAYFIGGISNPLYFKKITKLIGDYNLEKKIIIGKSLDDPALIDCYFSCDMFVLPSSMETFPLVILEAMFAGLPIVSTSVGGIPDVIVDGYNGFLVKPNDPNHLFEKCLQLMKNDELRIMFSKVNKKIAEEYTWKKVASQTYQLYSDLTRA